MCARRARCDDRSNVASHCETAACSAGIDRGAARRVTCAVFVEAPLRRGAIRVRFSGVGDRLTGMTLDVAREPDLDTSHSTIGATRLEGQSTSPGQSGDRRALPHVLVIPAILDQPHALRLSSGTIRLKRQCAIRPVALQLADQDTRLR